VNVPTCYSADVPYEVNGTLAQWRVAFETYLISSECADMPQCRCAVWGKRHIGTVACQPLEQTVWQKKRSEGLVSCQPLGPHFLVISVQTWRTLIHHFKKWLQLHRSIFTDV